MSRYQEFLRIYAGKQIDVDGFPPEQPFQCVDLFDSYSMFLGGPNMVGNAKEYADNDYKFWAWIPKGTAAPKQGDGVVWGAMPGNPWGHIAIYDSPISGGFRSFDQNIAGPYCTLINHVSDTRYVLGYLRVIGDDMSAEREREELRNLFHQSNYKLAEWLYKAFTGKDASDAAKRKWVNIYPVDRIVEGIKAETGGKLITENEAVERLRKIKELTKE